MEDILQQMISRLAAAPAPLAYLALFASAVVENLFPPVPGDTITAFGAFMVGAGTLDFTAVYLSTTAGSVCGFMLLVYLGRFLGREFFLERDYRFFSAKSILDAERWFLRYGHFVVLANRFLPGIRSVISLVSGISMLPPLKVLAFASISAAVWNFIWIYAGYTLGNNWELVRGRLGDILKTYNLAAAIIMASAIAVFIAWKIAVRRRNSHRE
jgi:membrane protein DedA with SNARE-associated domain